MHPILRLVPYNIFWIKVIASTIPMCVLYLYYIAPYNIITLYSDERNEGEYNSILNLRFRAQTWGMYYISLSLSIDHWSNLVLHTYLITNQKLVKHSAEPVLSDHHARTDTINSFKYYLPILYSPAQSSNLKGNKAQCFTLHWTLISTSNKYTSYDKWQTRKTCTRTFIVRPPYTNINKSTDVIFPNSVL